MTRMAPLFIYLRLQTRGASPHAASTLRLGEAEPETSFSLRLDQTVRLFLGLAFLYALHSFAFSFCFIFFFNLFIYLFI
jgi:hypothetical protein